MDDLGAKILSNIDGAFKKDGLIDEYDFLPIVECTSNRNPVVLVEHKLGVELWAAQVLYCHAHQRLIAWRKSSQRITVSDVPTLTSLTRAVLLVTADCTTAWNIRKELVTVEFLQWEEDIKLCNLVLTKHHKSSETFAHKKWLLKYHTCKKMHQTMKLSAAHTQHSTPNEHISSESNTLLSASNESTVQQLDCDTRNLIEDELSVCTKAASRYPNNYYAWTHRLWVIHTYASCQLQILKTEMTVTESFVCSHVSDYSGFHYRHQVLLLLQKLLSWEEHNELLIHEGNLTLELINRYSGHEALWYHRRFVVEALLARCSARPQSFTVCMPDIAFNHQHAGCSKKTKLESSQLKDLSDHSSLMQKELQWCAKELEASAPGSWHAKLVNNHTTWLKNRFG